jgi:hypothetical protein
MLHSRSNRHRTAALVAAAILLTVSACDETLSPDGEPAVESMRLVIGSQTVTVSPSGVTGGPIDLGTGANTVTAFFLGANGLPDPNVSAAAFQLNVQVLGGAPITFQRSATNPFAGTLTATAAVQGAQIRFSLFHIEEQHEDFGPFTVTANVS